MFPVPRTKKVAKGKRLFSHIRFEGLLRSRVEGLLRIRVEGLLGAGATRRSEARTTTYFDNANYWNAKGSFELRN